LETSNFFPTKEGSIGLYEAAKRL